MANKSTKPIDKQIESLNSTSTTKVILEAIVINENKNENTKLIQFIDKNGKLDAKTLIIDNNLIKSENKIKVSKKTSFQELILNNWFRKEVTNKNNNDIIYILDANLLIKIISYSLFEYSIKLTRSLSLGIIGDRHHLHIRQVEVYSKLFGYCDLEFNNRASECVLKGSILNNKARTPHYCIDGIKSIGSFNHSDYSNRAQSNSQDHWMEFTIDPKHNFIDNLSDIGYIKIYNRTGGCSIRLQGSSLELFRDGNLVKQWTINSNKQEYTFYN